MYKKLVYSFPSHFFSLAEPYKGPKLRPAPGAYPVYYSGAFVNGKFGKSIRAFTADEFEKQNFL